MRAWIKDLSVTVAWSLIMSSIMLQSLYERPLLTALDLTLLFLASFFAGLILVDAGIIVFGYMGSLVLSLLTMFVSLSLPALLGRVKYLELESLVYSEALSSIVRIVFPVVLVICLVGAFLGGIMGEHFGLR